MEKINVVKEIRELKNQLSYSKNIGFFLGAGSSCAVGIPNITQLTNDIEQSLTEPLQKHFKTLKADLISVCAPKAVNIEDVLNQIRRIRELTAESKDKKYLDIDGESSKKLDVEICKLIYQKISEKEKIANLESIKKFLAWLCIQNPEYSKEIFTTNYDLILEKSLEEIQIPYFDGFVGSYEPFFWQESIEKFVVNADITKNWLRLWKIHGSLSWFWKKNEKTNSHKVVRLGKVEKIESETNELVIYPSKDKYDSSRKQPFIAYFDRLKKYLTNGELLFVFCGYSFSDQHINEIIFNSLRQNNRLFSIVFFYNDSEVEAFYKIASSYLNLSVFGPKKAFINGVMGEWSFEKDELKTNETEDSFWNCTDSTFLLGDFNKLANFLIASSGKRESIEAIINE